MCGPTLLKENVGDYFINKGLFKFNGTDFYNAYLNSQD